MSLQHNDLIDLVSSKIHIDEYSSKMGDDKDVVVTSFKVKYYDPALELSNFLEKGYDWVLDADVSSGEMEDGSYLVFIETLRRPSFPNNLIKVIEDLEGVTGIAAEEYVFAYHKERGYHQLTADNIKSMVPLTPREYPQQDVGEESIMQSEDAKMLEAMQMAAGLTPKTKAVTDPALKHFVNLSKR